MTETRTLTRRRFVKKSASLLAGAMAIPTIIPRHVLSSSAAPGANDRVGIGYIGVGRRAGQLRGLPPNTQVVGVADCNIARAKDWAKKYSCPAHQDYRTLLESAAVDGVIIATPDHWHALHTIHACQAQKDVYCEKPINLTIREGQAMVKAVRKHGRIFQAGSQQRTDTYDRIGSELVRSGAIGKVHTVLTRNLESPWVCKLPAQPVPQEINWDMWCGQTEPRPYHKDIYLPRADPGWISFHCYSGGEMTGWGAHSLDQIQCALGTDSGGPVEVWIDETPEFKPLVFTEPKSRKWGYSTCTKPPVHFRYASGTVVSFGKGPGFGGIFEGEKGKITIDRAKLITEPKEIGEEALKDAKIQVGTDIHIKNWVDCMISRERPNADIQIAHRSTVVCHLGNIARWLGRKVHWDPAQEVFPGDDEANTFLERPMRKPYNLPETV